MNSRVDKTVLFDIPKVELHCHLELAYRPSTMMEWAIEDEDIEKECSLEDFKTRYMVLSPMLDLPSVLQKFLVVVVRQRILL